MKILYIVPYTPNPIRVRPYSLIRALAQLGHSVTLATLWERPEECETLESFRALGVDVIAAPLPRARRAWNAVRALPTTVPMQATYCDSPALKRLLGATLGDHPGTFDVIHVEHLRGARYGLWYKARATSEPTPVVWDSVDCITYLFEQAVQRSQSLFGRVVTRLELSRTRRYEGWLVGQFDRVLVTSQVDQRALQTLTERLAQPAHIDVLTNGVDLDFFRPRENSRLAGTLVFTGKMSYHANETAALYLAREVMPLVWAQQPDARLVIAGSRPSQAIRNLSTTYPRCVEVTGFLPDMRVPLQEAGVAAAPLLYGAGVQNKVLEAMACATPVVATSLAVAALGAQHGRDCLVADTPQAFAEAVLTLLRDAGLRARIGAAGRNYVEAHHDWHDIAAQLVVLYRAARASLR